MVANETWRTLPDTRAGGRYKRHILARRDCFGPRRRHAAAFHQNEDEYLFVLEGTACFALGDKVFDVEAGTMVSLPRNIPHAWGNRSDLRLRIAAVCYPGGVEEALRIIAGGGLIDIPALAARFGVIALGPAPF